MKFAVLDHTGHRDVEWDPNDPNSVVEAKKEFEALVKSGHIAYELDASGKRGRKLDKFDPSVERVVVTRPPVGG